MIANIFFVKNLTILFSFSIDENECKDVEYLDEKYEFRDQAFPKDYIINQ